MCCLIMEIPGDDFDFAEMHEEMTTPPHRPSTGEDWERILDEILAFDRSIFHCINQEDMFHTLHSKPTTAIHDDSSISSALEEEELRKVKALEQQYATLLARMKRLMGGLQDSSSDGVDNEGGQQKKARDAQPFKVKIEKLPREDYGLDLSKMKSWVEARNERLAKQESYIQEMAIGRVRGFLDAVRMVTRLQTWWRMITFRKEFAEFRATRLVVKEKFFVAWKRQWVADKMHLYQSLGKPFEAWALETSDSKRLRFVVKDFFAMCIKRLKLTPQAVMVFFAPKDPTEEDIISEADSMKIRRLILSKLFSGWRYETRELRGQRFKATQILTRTMRKHKGPMWVKEGLLVCYHIWHRYTAVRLAYRLEEPDPVFKNPFLPQWAKLLQKITLSRIHRKRAQEKGEMLLLKRNFRSWRFIMTMDRSKMMTPLAIAINHWNNKVWTKVFGAWSGYLKERGTISRIRNMCFAAWKIWAPRKSRLSKAKKATIVMVKRRAVRRAYGVMTAQCFEVIGKRAGALRILRDNFQNRKLLICAYALMHRNSQVIMLDCWRRWCMWKHNRKRWACTLWQFRFLYFDTKMRAIVSAWRNFARVQREVRGGAGVEGVILVNVSQTSTPVPEEKHSPKQGRKSIAMNSHESQQTGLSWSQEAQHHCLRVFRLAQKDEVAGRPSKDAFMLFCRAISISSGKSIENKTRADMQKQLEDEDDVGSTAGSMDATSIVTMEAGGPTFLDGCYSRGGSVVGSIDAAINQIRKGSNVSKQPNHSREDGLQDNGAEGESADNDEAGEESDDDENPFEEQSIFSGTNGPNSMTESLKILLSQAPPPPNVQEEVQLKLQRGVDLMDMRTVALAVEEGARIDANHVCQVANHFGDYSITLFVQLLTGSLDFVAQRVLRQDRLSIVLQCANPLNALIANEHIKRWENMKLSTREIENLTQDKALSNAVGSMFSAVTLFRAVVVLALKKREDVLRNNCQILPQNRTVDQEVQETIKRNALKRVLDLRRNLIALMEMDGVFGGGPMYDLDEYPEPPPIVGAPAKATVHDNSWAMSMNIEQLLFEFTSMMSNLTTEALALRTPLLQRDNKLLHNGFMNQSRKDFLLLRESTLSVAERKAKAAKDSEKARKVAQKAAKERRKIEKQFEKEFYSKKNDDIHDDNSDNDHSESKGADEDAENDEEDVEEEKSTKNTRGKSKGKGKKGGKKATKEPIETDEMREAFELMDDKDEYHVLLKPYDPVLIQSAEKDIVLSSLQEPEEEKDQEEEAIFQSRNAIYSNLLFETWMPVGKKSIRQVKIQLCARACKAASMVPRRALTLIKQASEYSNEHRSSIGGFGMWILSKAVDKSTVFYETDRALWPEEYWDLFQMESKLKLDKILLRTMLNGLVSSVESDLAATVDLNEQKKELENYLKDHRSGLVEIGERRRNKIANDVELSKDNERLKSKYLQEIADMESQQSRIRQKNQQTEVYFASGSFHEVLKLLGGDEEHDPHVEADKSALQIRAHQLVREKELEIESLDGSIAQVRLQLENVEKEIRSFARFCYRAESWLRGLAESHFNMMLDAQQIVQRLIKNKYDVSRKLGSMFPWISSYRKKVKENKVVLQYVAKEKNRHIAELEAAEEEERRYRNLPPGSREKRTRRKKGGQQAIDDSFSIAAPDETPSSNAAVMDDAIESFLKKKFYDGEIQLDETSLLEANYDVGHSGIEPRKFTVEEEEMILKGTSAAEIVERKMQEEIQAQHIAEEAEQERKRQVQEKLAMDQMQCLLEIEQEAMLVMHKLRAKIFDDYWDLIIPMKIDQNTDSRAVSRATSRGEKAPDSSRSSRSGFDGTFKGDKDTKDDVSSNGDDFSRTRRQWIAIGDEHWKSKRGLSTRKTLADMAEQEGGPALVGLQSSTDSSVVIPVLPSEMDVGNIAWRSIEGMNYSIYMGKDDQDKIMSSLQAAVSRPVTADTPFVVEVPDELDPSVGKRDKSARRSGVASPSISRSVEDPFSAVGKKEVLSFQASVLRFATLRKSKASENYRDQPEDDDATEDATTVASVHSNQDETDYIIDLAGANAEDKVAEYAMATMFGGHADLEYKVEEKVEEVQQQPHEQAAVSPSTPQEYSFDNLPIPDPAPDAYSKIRLLNPLLAKFVENNDDQSTMSNLSRDGSITQAGYAGEASMNGVQSGSPRPVSFVIITGKDDEKHHRDKKPAVRFAGDSDDDDDGHRSYYDEDDEDVGDHPTSSTERILNAQQKTQLPHYEYSSMDLGLLSNESELLRRGGTPDNELFQAQLALKLAQQARSIPIPELSKKRGKQTHKALTASQRTLPEKPRPTAMVQSLFLTGKAPDVAPAPSTQTIVNFMSSGQADSAKGGMYIGDGGMEDGSILLSKSLSESLGLINKSQELLELSDDVQFDEIIGAEQLQLSQGSVQRSFASLLAMVHAELSEEFELQEPNSQFIIQSRRKSTRGILQNEKVQVKASADTHAAPSTPVNVPSPVGALSPTQNTPPPVVSERSPAPLEVTINSISTIRFAKREEDAAAAEINTSQLRPLTPDTLVLLGESVKKLLAKKEEYERSLLLPPFVHYSQATINKKLKETALKRKDNYLHFTHEAVERSLVIDGRMLALAENANGATNPSLWHSSSADSPVQRVQDSQEILRGTEHLDFDAAFSKLAMSPSVPMGLGKLTAPDSSLLLSKLHGRGHESDSALIKTKADRNGAQSSPFSQFLDSDTPLQGQRYMIPKQPSSAGGTHTSSKHESSMWRPKEHDQSYLRELEAIYSKLLGDDDGSLQEAYIAALGLLPPPTPVVRPTQERIDDELYEEEEEEEEELLREVDEEDLYPAESIAGSVRSGILQPPAPCMEEENFLPGTSSINNPLVRPGSGMSFMRVSSPHPSPSGRLRPRSISPGALGESLSSKLAHSKILRQSSESFQIHEGEGEEKGSLIDLQDTRPLSPSQAAAHRVLAETGLKHFISPVKSVTTSMSSQQKLTGGERNSSFSALNESKSIAPHYTADAFSTKVSEKYFFASSATASTIPKQIVMGGVAVVPVAGKLSGTLSGSSAGSAELKDRDSGSIGGRSKAAAKNKGRDVKDLSFTDHHALTGNCTALEKPSSASMGPLSQSTSSKFNWESPYFSQVEQSHYSSDSTGGIPYAYQDPFVLPDDVEEDLELQLRSILGSGKSSKKLGSMMKARYSATDSAAALMAEMSSAVPSRTLVKGKATKIRRLGGGKLLPPLESAGNVNQVMAALQSSSDPSAGILDVLAIADRPKPRLLISKGWEEGKSSSMIRKGLKSNKLQRSLESLIAARPKSKE